MFSLAKVLENLLVSFLVSCLALWEGGTDVQEADKERCWVISRVEERPHLLHLSGTGHSSPLSI